MTDLTLDTDLNKEQRESLEIVRQSSYSFLQMLNTLLDFSKIETGKVELEETEFDVFNLIKEIINILKVQAKKKGLVLESRTMKSVPEFIIGDPLRLKQIIINLVGNAIKFTEEGHIRLTVALGKNGEFEAALLFSVEDTGVGIPADKLDVIFESFRQLDGSTTRKYGGTGLGLTIAKRLIELMGGKIQVTSVENEGSCFSFALSFKKGKGESGVKKQKRKKILSRDNLSLLKVLVAEDDPIAQKMIQRVLEKRGHTVFGVSNGQAAVEILRKVKFDVLLMDVEMPILNGLDATKKIRQMRNNPAIANIPIVAMTAHARREDRDRCLQMGMNHYIAKPIDLGELLNIIESYEEKKTMPASPVQPRDATAIDFSALISYRKILENEGRIPYNFIHKELLRFRTALKQAVETFDNEFVEKEADELKEFAVKLGAVNIKEDAFRLKMAARRKTLHAAKEILSRLDDAIARFLDELALAPEIFR
jgi:CheY-like chemotaxis protein